MELNQENQQTQPQEDTQTVLQRWARDNRIPLQVKEVPTPLESVEETKRDVEYLLKVILFPKEFYPENSFSRSDQWKVEPLPFYRMGEGKLVVFNPNTDHYETMTCEEACTLLESLYNIPNTRQNGEQSRAKRAILRIALSQKPVSYCGLIAGYEGGVYETRSHELVIVPYTERITPPANTKGLIVAEEGPPPPYFEKWEPLWRELFCPLLVNPETGDEIQYELFCKYIAGARRVIGQGYDAKIPALAIVGPAGTGKTLLGDIVNAALTGRSADPSTYLYGETPFNSHLVGATLWKVDDKQLRDNKTADRLKETIVGNGFQVSKKNVAATPMVYPVRAIMIMSNDDLFSRRTIPVISASTSDKIILFKAYPGGIPSSDRESRWKRLMEALPYWLAFLDKYVWPDMERTGRMIVSAWQNPEIMQMVFDDTEDGDLHTILQTLLNEKPELNGQAKPAHEWLKELEDCEQTQRDVYAMNLSPRKFGRRISTIAERFPGLYERQRSSGGSSLGKRTRLIEIHKEAG